MARLPFPLDRLPGLPADVLGALRVLPGMAADTASMARSTAVLGDVAKATQTSPERADMARVAEATGCIAQIDARMANIEAAMPVLVEVQQHLATLPETMDRLDRRLAQLADQLEALQRGLEPIGLVAQRVPGQRRAARRAAAAAE
jgi:septal ring factor EnvC (AmiA/AmiB activator)